MPFYRINQVTLPVADGSSTETPRDVGSTHHAFDGTPRVTRRARKRDASVRLVPMSISEAYSWEGLLCGLGESWSFDSHLYGSKGTGPTTSTGASVGGTGRYGAALVGTSSLNLVYPVPMLSTPGWTVMFERNATAVAGSGNWSHYIVRSDGAKWLNGVRADGTATAFFSAGSTSFAFAGDGATRWYDELVVFPFKVLDAWGPSLYAQRAYAWPSLPQLHLSGNGVVEAANRTCLATVTGKDTSQAVYGGSWQALHSLTVEFLEV